MIDRWVISYSDPENQALEQHFDTEGAARVERRHLVDKGKERRR